MLKFNLSVILLVLMTISAVGNICNLSSLSIWEANLLALVNLD